MKKLRFLLLVLAVFVSQSWGVAIDGNPGTVAPVSIDQIRSELQGLRQSMNCMGDAPATAVFDEMEHILLDDLAKLCGDINYYESEEATRQAAESEDPAIRAIHGHFGGTVLRVDPRQTELGSRAEDLRARVSVRKDLGKLGKKNTPYYDMFQEVKKLDEDLKKGLEEFIAAGETFCSEEEQGS